MAAILPVPVDYSDKDFESLRTRLISLIESVFPTWTSHEVADFGNVVMELFAFVGDNLAFYQDNQANEMFRPTTHQTAIRLARLFGYAIPARSAAQATERFSLAAAISKNISLAAGTVVRTPDITNPIRFQLLSALVLTAGQTNVSGLVEHSQTITELLASNNGVGQRFLLTRTPYVDSSMGVTTSQGTWVPKTSLLTSKPGDLHFVVEVDHNERPGLRFGDGVRGTIPTGTITCTYKIDGGAAGNVEAGKINVIDGSFTDVEGNPVTLAVTNLLSASGGADRQAVAETADQLPVSLTAPRTTVGRTDYETHALEVAGVARALMLTADEDVSVGENRGFLYVVPDGGGAPSQALLDAVKTHVTVTKPNTVTFRLDVVAAPYLTTTVRVRVYFAAGYVKAAVANTIRTNLTSFFAVSNSDGTQNTNVDFGFNYKDADGDPAGEIAWSDIFNVIRDTTGVRKIGDETDALHLNGVDNDVPIALREFPVLGATVTIIDGDTGSSL